MSFRSSLIRAGRSTRSLSQIPVTYNVVPGIFALRLTTMSSRRLVHLDRSAHIKLESLAQRLHDFVRCNKLAEVHRFYPALVENVKTVKSTHPDVSIASLFNREQLEDMLDALAASGRPFDLALVEKILTDMQDLFGLTPTADDHTTIVHALIRHGNVQTIQRWVLTMPRKPGHVIPSLEHWHLFLEFCREQGEVGSLRAAIKAMHRSGCKPTNASYKILINALFESSHHAPQLVGFSSIIDEMKQEGLPYDQAVLTALRRGYAKHRHHQRAIQVERLYLSHFSQVQDKLSEVSNWNKQLEEEVYKHGARATVKLCKIFQQEGFVPSSYTLTAILRNSTSLSDLRHAEKELGLQATVIHWSILICNNIRAGDLNSALSTYNESQKYAIVPDAAMLHPIISALCNTSLKPPDETAIDRALVLYQDLVRASSSQTSFDASTGSFSPRFGHSSGPDANIYNALLRAISSSTNMSKYFPVAMSLLDDMQSRELSLESSITTTSLTILLMRNASSPSEAFDVYRRMRGNNKCNIDAKGYAVLLNAFCKLSFGEQSPLPSLHYYFEIVKDMRRSGHDMNVEVYTILLRQLAFLATRMDKSLPEHFADDLVAAVRRAHNHLTVDASISPDIAVWNQLMDTYQRAGCFGEAYRVWEMIYLSGTFDNTSVSVILDACGYALAWPVAAQICLKLLKDGFSFNQKNWNAWLECLCRLGKLNEAVKMVCLEMGSHQDGVAPDEESVRILLKFANKTNQQVEIQSRIKRYLPDLWQNLPPDLRGSL